MIAALAALALALAVPRAGLVERPSAPPAPSAAPAADEDAVDPGPPQVTVDAVQLLVPAGEDPAGLDAAVPVKAGDRLSMRALRRAIELLYGLGRFGDVVARIAPVSAAPDHVVLVLECMPRRTVASLKVVTAGGIEEERARRAARIAPGDELWPGRLDEASERVRAASARAGYPRAAVRARVEGARQASVEIVVDAGPPTRVLALDLGDAPPAVTGAVATRPGGVLDLDQLDADVRALRAALRREGWLRARVGVPAVVTTADGARVTVPIAPGPHVAFRFAGNAGLSSAELRGQLGLDSEPALDAAAIEAAAGRIRAAYQARGFAEARVEASEQPAHGGVTVLFEIEEGRRYRVREVRFPGATQRGEGWARERFLEALEALAPPDPSSTAADTERLQLSVGTAPSRRAPPPVRPGDAWDPPLWDAAVARVLEIYRSDGYLDAAHEGTRVTLDAHAGLADVEVRLKEGVQTRVEGVAFEGNSSVPVADLAREARLAPGDPLSFAAVEETRAAVLALYARRGHLYARVVDASDFSADRRQATVRFRIAEGPLVRVGNVLIAGARRTREDVVREVLAVHAGDVYDPDAAARSQAALLRLGAFRSVGLRLSDPELPETSKDLTIDIAERPWRTLAPGIGYSLANGPRATVELVQPNVLGRALELSARAKVNYPPTSLRRDLGEMPFAERTEGRAEVGLHDPRAHLLGTTVGARVDAIAERLHRPSYDLSRASTIFGLELPAAQHVSVTLQYELEVDHVLLPKNDDASSVPLTHADVELLRFPEGVTTLNSLRPVVALDWRDDPLRPRRGWFASATADYSHSIGSKPGNLLGVFPGSDVFTHIVKLSGTVSGYLPLGSASALALSLRGGRVFPLEARSQTIPPKRFFLGGASTMRGYGEDEMIPEDLRAGFLDQVRACAGSITGLACTALARQGGEVFALGKVELRVPLRDSLELGVFADVGNLWRDPAKANLAELRVNFGLGLRFATPIGPAVLDVGFNPDPDRRLAEGVVAPHFSIGVF